MKRKHASKFFTFPFKHWVDNLQGKQFLNFKLSSTFSAKRRIKFFQNKFARHLLQSMTKSCIQKDLIRKCKLPSYSSYKCFGKIIKTKLHGMQLLIQDFLGRGERQPIRRCQPIITGRNEVVAKVMFLLVSVILSTGGRCLPQCMLGYPPGADTPQGRHHPPRADITPQSRHPPWEQTLP